MQTNVPDCACSVNQVWGWSGPVWWLWRFRWPQGNWPMLSRLSFCLFQTLPMLHHSLCMHGRWAVPGSVEIPVVDRCAIHLIFIEPHDIFWCNSHYLYPSSCCDPDWSGSLTFTFKCIYVLWWMTIHWTERTIYKQCMFCFQWNPDRWNLELVDATACNQMVPN